MAVVESEEKDGSVAFVLRLNDKSSVNLIATSSRPEVTDSQYCKQWVAALRKAQSIVPRSFGSAANTGMMF